MGQSGIHELFYFILVLSLMLNLATSLVFDALLARSVILPFFLSFAISAAIGFIAYQTVAVIPLDSIVLSKFLSILISISMHMGFWFWWWGPKKGRLLIILLISLSFAGLLSLGIYRLFAIITQLARKTG